MKGNAKSRGAPGLGICAPRTGPSFFQLVGQACFQLRVSCHHFGVVLLALVQNGERLRDNVKYQYELLEVVVRCHISAGHSAQRPLLDVVVRCHIGAGHSAQRPAGLRRIGGS